jgi:hypothetical protein
MKGSVLKSFALVVVALSVILVATPVRTTAGREMKALDNVPRFLEEIEDAGFTWQEGAFAYVDPIKKTCEGDYPTAMGNNPWPSAYFQLQMPNPEDAGYPLPIVAQWQMEQDEAIVIIGQTPPAVRYFSIQTWAQLGPAIDPLPAPIGTRPLIGSAFGDTTNNLTIHTTGKDPFSRLIVYIIVANRETESRVRAAALGAGYPAAIINVETLSQVIAPLGIGPAGSILVTLQRNAVPANKDEFEEYVRRSIPGDPLYDPPYRAFRLSPVEELAADPFPVPTLRVRGTGQSELDLLPALKSLRQAILDKEAERVPALPATPLGIRFWQDPMPKYDGQLEYIDEPWAGLQRGEYSYLGSRDTNYFQTYPYFKLRSDVDEYVIVYGVNHHTTGKATYESFSVYVEPTFGTGREIGLGMVSDPRFDWAGLPGDSARQYLQPGDPYYEVADMLFAWKIARQCTEGEAYCLEVGDLTDINGIPYNENCNPQISLDPDPDDPDEPVWKTDLFVVFRGYMEPATAVSPDSNELVWDQAIYFGPYLP